MASRRTGELFQTRGELEFEWSIKYFFPLTEEVDSYFKSPKFYFAVSSWEIWIYPNGDTRKSSQGCIDLYLAKMSEGFPVTVDWSLKIKSLRSETDLVLNRSCDFVRKNVGKGLSKIILRSELIDRKSEFTLSNDLTVICTLKNSKRHGVTGK